MADLAAFLPRNLLGLVATALAGEDAFRQVRGGVLFCDVAGFTPLTEALSVLGKEGAEELTRLLNGYFGRMIGIMEEEGGDVLRFGGDSMAVLFPGDDAKPALRAASKMMGAMGEFASLQTRAGAFKLSMKIGAAFGDVLLGILGDGAGAYEFYATGPPLDESAEAEHHSKAGLIICHPSVAKACTGMVPLHPHRDGFTRLTGPVKRGTENLPKAPPTASADLLRLVPPYLADHHSLGMAGEHRGTAVLFASFQGAPATGAGAREVHRHLEEAYRAFSGACRRYGGVVNKLDMGDKGAKALLLFGSPHALEQKEEMATRTALDLLKSPALRAGGGLRMGLTSAPLFTGPVGSQTRREYTVMGDGINLAARLMQAAAPGQVLCDGRVAAAAAGSLRFRELPPISVKGKKAPVVPHEPVGEVEEGEGSGVVLVERETLCKELKEYLLQGQGPPRVMVGQAGAGKTAVLEWLRAEAKRRGLPVSRAYLGPYSVDRPYSAWRSHVRFILNLSRAHGPEAVREALLAALAPEPPEYRHLLNPLLDLPEAGGEALKNLSPKERKDLSFAILGRLLARSGSRAFLVDNLQWADPLSLEFLGFLLEDPEPPPWRLVVTMRPGSQAVEPFLPRLRGNEIAPLSLQGTAALLKKIHGLAEPEKGVLEWFVARSRGNPAVVAALVSALEGAGLLKRDAYGARVDSDRLFQTTFPDTLEGLYLARVDGFPARSRAVLQQASVLGAAVSGNLLIRITGLEGPALDEALAPLTQSGILQADTWGARPYYRFSDGLLRDAVYEAMPFSLKREAHLHLAEFLAPEAGGNPRLWPTLAHHFEQAGEDARARTYHRLAGRDAAARSDNPTALKHLEFVCREITPASDDIEDAFRLLDVYSLLGRWPDGAPILGRLVSMEGGFGPATKSRIRNFQSIDSFMARDWAGTEAVLLEGIALAEEAGDPALQGRGLVNIVGRVYGPTGQLDKAKACLEKALALPEGPDQAVFRTMAAMNLGAVHKHLGSLADSTKWLRAAYRMATKEKLGPQRGNIADNLGAVFCDSGQFEKAVTWGRRAVSILDTFAFRSVAQNARYNLGVALLSSGRASKVLTLLAKISQQAEATGNLQVMASAYQAMSQASTQEGSFSDCLDYASHALRHYRELHNARDYKFTLLGPGALVHDLQEPGRAAEIWVLDQVGEFLENCSPDMVADAGLARLRRWMEGKTPAAESAASFADQGADISPEEGIERYLWTAEMCLHDGRKAEALRFVQKANCALKAWPHFDSKVRYLGLLSNIRKLTSQERAQALSLLNRSTGGVWGLRLLCLLSRSEKLGKDREKLLRTARKRLAFCREHSPEWAWTKIASFQEVASVLKECDGDNGSGKRRAGGRKTKTATVLK